MKEKTILNDDQSKIDFLKKMSNTFGYGMPNNEETNSTENEKREERKIPITRPRRKISSKSKRPFLIVLD